MQTFEQLQAEYEAAKEARDEAERRLDAAYAALRLRRCGIRFDVARRGEGYIVYRYCTLECDHDGAHAN